MMKKTRRPTMRTLNLKAPKDIMIDADILIHKVACKAESSVSPEYM